MKRLSKPFPGLPAAQNVEQAILLAQLQILRKLNRERGHALLPMLVSLLVAMLCIGLGMLVTAKVIFALSHIL